MSWLYSSSPFWDREPRLEVGGTLFLSRRIGELGLLSFRRKPNLGFAFLGFSSAVYGACGDVVGGAFFLATLTVQHASEFNEWLLNGRGLFIPTVIGACRWLLSVVEVTSRRDGFIVRSFSSFWDREPRLQLGGALFLSRRIGELGLLSFRRKPNLGFAFLGFSSAVYGACGDVVGGAFFLATLTVLHASEFNSSGVISASLLLFILLMIPSQLRRSSSL